jgi:chaperonin GroEL
MTRNTCFVLMPFSEPYRDVYDVAIRSAMNRLGFACTRSDDLDAPRNVMKDVVDHINRSTLIVADLTGTNANVFYELGISHSLAKKTILLAQSVERDIPFDLRSYRVITYSPDPEGLVKLGIDLWNTAGTLVRRASDHGNPVLDFLPGATRARLLDGLGHFPSAADRTAAVRDDMLRQIDELGLQVRTTFGPYGHPIVVRDGNKRTLVSKEFRYVRRAGDSGGSHADNVPLQLLSNLLGNAGDQGAKESIIIAQSVYRDALHLIESQNVSFVAVKSGLVAAKDAAMALLQEMSRPVTTRAQLKQIATAVAGGDEEIGNLIVEAMEKVGKDGVITVEQAKGVETTLETVEGMQFDRGYGSPYFVTDPDRMEAVLDDALVLIHDKKISTMKDLLPILEKVAQMGRPLLVIAEEVEGEALATLVVNKLRGTLRVCAVKAPGFGDRRKAILQDIAVLTGAQVISEDVGFKLENAVVSDLGRAKRIVVDKDNTTIIDGAGSYEVVEGRVREIRTAIDKTTSDYDREKLQERLAKVAGGVAVIRVGAATEMEMLEGTSRVEWSLEAVRRIGGSGALPGGGVAYLHVAERLGRQEEATIQGACVRILRAALEEPIRQLLTNANLDPDPILDQIRTMNDGEGYLVDSGTYGDLFDAGILDPTRTVRMALHHAIALATQLLTGQVLNVAPPPGESGSGDHAPPPSHV